MLQLADKLSLVELPCLVEEQLIDELCHDLNIHRDQNQDHNLYNDSMVFKPVNSNHSSKGQPDGSKQDNVQETSAKIQKELGKDNDVYQSFNQTIDQSTHSEMNSSNHSFNLDSIEQDTITNLLEFMLGDGQLTSTASTASSESEQETEVKTDDKLEAEPEKHVQREITRPAISSPTPKTSSSERSSRR